MYRCQVCTVLVRLDVHSGAENPCLLKMDTSVSAKLLQALPSGVQQSVSKTSWIRLVCGAKVLDASKYLIHHSTLYITVPYTSKYPPHHSTLYITVPDTSKYPIHHSTIYSKVPDTSQYLIHHSILYLTVPYTSSYPIHYSTWYITVPYTSKYLIHHKPTSLFSVGKEQTNVAAPWEAQVQSNKKSISLV